MIAGIHPGPPVRTDQDVVAARRYRHSLLADRPVVRLVGETMGPAVDLELEYLGFAPPERVTVVGAGLREALGFPAWALVNDPANGHHALNLVKELTRLTRVAAVKPGNAKTELIAIGTRLSGSAPHFLPSFYEQAGRIFLAHNNVTAARTMFTKAREAERVHALAVDPVQLRDVYLEFGLAGALSGKDMSEYARWLGEHAEPDEAQEHFLSACVRWLRSGLPPYATMAKDLNRLANRDVGEALLTEALAVDSAKRATKTFWESQRKTLVSLAARDPAVRARMLEFVPKDAPELWLVVLQASGATAALTEPDGDIDAAAWLGKFVRQFTVRGNHTMRPAAYRHAPLRELIVAMAVRLRADGVVVDLPADPDLLDLCLAHQIPVAPTAKRIPLDKEIVIQRDLNALVADKRFWPALFDGLESELVSTGSTHSGHALRRISTTAGLRALLPDWLASIADKISTAGLARLNRLLDRYTLTPELFSLAPHAAQQIADIDVAETLAATLRSGLLDELGWPALDKAVAKLAGKRPEPGKRGWQVEIIGEAWPALIVASGLQVIVVGPDDILMEHTVRIPPDRWNTRGTLQAFYVDGKLMVCWFDKADNRLAYWSDRPERIFRARGLAYQRQGEMPASIATPGGRFVGGGVLHPGDTKVPDHHEVHSDGTSRWHEVPRFDSAKYRWTADWQPAELPDFLAGLATGCGWLRPVVPGTENSVFGSADGLHGWRTIKQPDGGWLVESVDGTRAWLNDGRHKPVAAFSLPGRPDPLTVAWCGGKLEVFEVDSQMLASVDSETYRPAMARGTELVAPLQWWHCLRVRDEAGSLVLRAMTAETARLLLDAREDELPKVIGEVLPQISHPALINGVLGAVGQAAMAVEKLAQYREIVQKVAAVSEAEPVPAIDDNLLSAALNGGEMYRSAGKNSILQTIAQLGELAKAGPLAKSVNLEGWPDGWLTALPYLGMVGMRAASPVTPAHRRKALVTYLKLVARTGIGYAPHWRTVTVEIEMRDPDCKRAAHPTEYGFLALIDRREIGRGLKRWTALQFTAVPGEFSLPPKWTTKDTSSAPDTFDINRFCELLARQGPWQWRPQAAVDLASRTGLSISEAALLLLEPLQARAIWEPVPTAIRETLGLSAAQATMAAGGLSALSDEARRAMLHAAMPAEPERLWTEGPDVAAVAAEWINRFGRRVAVAEDVLLDAAKTIRYRRVNDVIAAILSPEIWERADTAKFTVGDQEDVVKVLSWLAYRLPAASPLRVRLPKALAKVNVQNIGLDQACGQGGAGGYLQDPTVSAPDLIDPVIEKYTVDKDVAVLYLQLLALPDPTDANVARWTGWKPARLKAARAALAETDLVLTAKRSRAGRTLFLPGHWLNRAAPLMPFEAWKEPLVSTRFELALPHGTVEAAFRQAWQRVEEGDQPRYEELR